jgi:hypothetical protein
MQLDSLHIQQLRPRSSIGICASPPGTVSLDLLPRPIWDNIRTKSILHIYTKYCYWKQLIQPIVNKNNSVAIHHKSFNEWIVTPDSIPDDQIQIERLMSILYLLPRELCSLILEYRYQSLLSNQYVFIGKEYHFETWTPIVWLSLQHRFKIFQQFIYASEEPPTAELLKHTDYLIVYLHQYIADVKWFFQHLSFIQLSRIVPKIEHIRNQWVILDLFSTTIFLFSP